MKSPCVAYPRDEPVVLIRASQVRICEGNHCAAALLSYFGYWHTTRAGNAKQAEHANKMAALHGEVGVQDTTLLQYHTEDEIEAGLLHLYGRKTIRAAIAFLIQKGFVSLQKNPNPRYRFDRTHYFLFHPTAVQEEIGVDTHQVKMPDRETHEEMYDEETESTINSSQVIDIPDQVKMPDRGSHFAASSGKTAAPIAEITTREEMREENQDLPPIVPQTPQTKRARTKAAQHPNTDYTPGFNKAWALYPRKEKKVDTFTIWRERGLEARAAEIAEKIARLQVTLWHRKEMRYIPLPTTWFNESRYEDDLIPLDMAQEVELRDRTSPREYNNLMAARRWQEEKFGTQRSPAIPRDDGEVIDSVSYRIE
jgi:hypothetical protein